MADNLKTILTNFGHLGVEALRTDVEKVSATKKTEQSIRFEVYDDSYYTTLSFIGRKFFKALETGRGPRKNSSYQEFDLSMLEYMQARGIGTELSDKKKKQLAKFLSYKINKEGDQTYKHGGRIVYTPTITKLKEEIKQAVAEFNKNDIRQRLVNELNRT